MAKLPQILASLMFTGLSNHFSLLPMVCKFKGKPPNIYQKKNNNNTVVKAGLSSGSQSLKQIFTDLFK